MLCWCGTRSAPPSPWPFPAGRGESKTRRGAPPRAPPQSTHDITRIARSASSTMIIKSPRSNAGTSPGLPEYSPPTIAPPTKTFGNEDWPVICRSATLFSGLMRRPGIHSFPSDTSKKSSIPILRSSATASEQNGEYSYVSYIVVISFDSRRGGHENGRENMNIQREGQGSKTTVAGEGVRTMTGTAMSAMRTPDDTGE